MKLKTIKTILSHPFNRNRKIHALFTFFKRGVAIRLHQDAMVYPFISGTRLVVEKGMSSAELQIYTGLYDHEEMLFLMHFLRPEDTFVDIGANVGVYSVLAAGVAGAHVISFEPIPSTFANLKRNIVYNQLQDRSQLFNMGVGDKPETLVFSNALDAVNHVITDSNYSGPVSRIPVDSLDNMMVTESPNFLKIDVEGFEANVINGAIQTLQRPELRVIIMETNGLSDQYEYGQNYIHNKLLSYGFRPFNYNPSTRDIIPIETPNPANTIYIKDLDFAKERIKTAVKIPVIGKMF
ncbi:FkbM family methyltransferase [Dyadobacter tibetensis]|uniref:FkbM family methyltransferase n=1 Tax=Dyadobacter tibetensis TaxID=1211851 RepID=UPI000472CFD5|nr:FkbM family methyltransferase [Dyadobacter tibetensis]